MREDEYLDSVLGCTLSAAICIAIVAIITLMIVLI